MSRPGRARVVVAGLGDTGVLTAVLLARHCDVTGISGKPGLVSGQELGLRLADPDRWARDYRLPFDRFRGLDRVRVEHALVTGADLTARTVEVVRADGSTATLPYDVLVVATGVANGFWRRPDLESAASVDLGLHAAHDRLAAAAASGGSIAVVGGGAAAVSAAGNVARRWPGARVDLYFPGDRALPQHHRRVWTSVRRRLDRSGVVLHPGHRAVLPGGAAPSEITTGPVAFSTGQPEVPAAAVVWAVGRATPNTGWLPTEVLDDDGFVLVGADLRVPGAAGVFAIGDVAATDPLRSSARNFTHRLLARNVRAHLAGRPLGTFTAPGRRWGSVLGPQPDGLSVYTPDGRAVRIPRRVVDTVLQPLVVGWGIYRGLRRPR